MKKELADFVGMKPKELIGKYCYKILHGSRLICPRDRQRHNQAVENIFATGKVQDIELNLVMVFVLNVLKNFTQTFSILIKKKNSTTTGSTRRRETRRPDGQVHWRRWLPWAFGGDIIEKDVI